MKKHEQYCATCWQYSNALGRCMITQCSERPDYYLAAPVKSQNLLVMGEWV